MNKPVSPTLCGCDAPRVVRQLPSVEEALARMRAVIQPIGETALCPLPHALDQVLAAPVCARSAMPPFDNAAMDGYALDTATLKGRGPWYLRVSDRIRAGATPRDPLGRGDAVRLFTGAPIPDGANAVVMQEAVTRQGETIRLEARPEPGAHLRPAGEVARKGAVLLPPGTRLGRREIALTAAAGHAEVTIRRRLRVALLITGDEIRDAGATRDGAGIWDVNGPMMAACLRRAGVEIVAEARAPDDRDATRALLSELSGRADLLVTTGGISVGEEDHVKPAMVTLGAQLHISGVAVKPGKPMCFGCLGNALWLGLPGNPVAAFTVWEVFGQALLAARQGAEPRDAAPASAVLAEPLTHKPGRTEYRLARITGISDSGLPLVSCPHGAAAGHVTWLGMADGLVCVPAACRAISPGEHVAFRPFRRPD